MLPKQHRLRSGAEIKAVFRAGNKLSGEFAIVHYCPGTGRSAFITPKSLGTAVQRNLVRRRARAVIERNLDAIANSDIVIRFHSKTKTPSFQELERDLTELIQRMKR